MASSPSPMDLTRIPGENLKDYIQRVFGTQAAFAKAAGINPADVSRFINHPSTVSEAGWNNFYTRIHTSLRIDLKPNALEQEQNNDQNKITQSPHFKIERSSSYLGINAMYTPFFYRDVATIPPIYAIWHKLFRDMRGVCSLEAFELTPGLSNYKTDFAPRTIEQFLTTLTPKFTVVPSTNHGTLANSHIGTEIHYQGDVSAIIVRAYELTNSPVDQRRYLALTVTPPKSVLGYVERITASSTLLNHLQSEELLSHPLSPSGEHAKMGFLHDWDMFAYDQFGYYCKMVGDHMVNLEKGWKKIATNRERESKQYQQRSKDRA